MKIKKRNIFIIVGIILAIELIWATWTLNKAAPDVRSQTVVNPPISPKLSETVISLKTPNKNLKVGEEVSVTINISSTKFTDGTDIILFYDPNLLSIVTSSGGNLPAHVGGMYSDYPINKVDEKNGRIAISGISAIDGGVAAQGAFGFVTFKAKAAGKARLVLDFTPKSTVDSNVIEARTSKDILNRVENLEFEIRP